MALADDQSFFEAVLNTAPAAVRKSIMLLADTLLPGLNLGLEVLAAGDDDDAKPAELRPDVLLRTFIAACQRTKEYPIIAIDEANAALAVADADALKSTQELLRSLIRVSKQERQASVVLATSEHGMPFRLRELSCTADHRGTSSTLCG